MKYTHYIISYPHKMLIINYNYDQPTQRSLKPYPYCWLHMCHCVPWLCPLTFFLYAQTRDNHRCKYIPKLMWGSNYCLLYSHDMNNKVVNENSVILYPHDINTVVSPSCSIIFQLHSLQSGKQSSIYAYAGFFDHFKSILWSDMITGLN